MDPKKVIETLVREITRKDDLPRFPTWPQVKAHLAASGLFAIEAIEAHQEEFQESFIRCKWEQIEEKYRYSKKPNVQTNGTMKMINTLVREMARGNGLPKFPTWSQLKAHLAASGLFSMEALEARQDDFQESFIRCKWEQIEEKNGHTSNPDPRIQTNTEFPPSPPRSRTPSDASRSDKAPEMKKVEAFQLTLDDEANATSPCVLSIYLEAKDQWQGAGFKHCLEDWSYMSSRWLNRYHLDTLDGRIWLTWRPNDKSETYVTKFVVIDGLAFDFMLGTKSMDEDFNRREPEKAPAQRLHSTKEYTEPLEGRLAHSRNHHLRPDQDEVDLMGRLILSVAKASKTALHYSSPYMAPTGHVADDGRSVSTDQDRHSGDSSPLP